MNFPPKKTLLSKAKLSHQVSVDMMNTIVDGADKGTDGAEESHQAAEEVAIVPEEQFENGGKLNDFEAGSEGKKSSSLKMNSTEENAEKEEHEEEQIDQECKINKEEKQDNDEEEKTEQECEITKQEEDDNAEDRSRPDSCSDRKKFIESESEADAVLHNELDTETEKNANEMVIEETCMDPQTDQERAGSVTELCEVPQVGHFSSSIPCFSVLPLYS